MHIQSPCGKCKFSTLFLNELQTSVKPLHRWCILSNEGAASYKKKLVPLRLEHLYYNASLLHKAIRAANMVGSNSAYNHGRA